MNFKNMLVYKTFLGQKYGYRPLPVRITDTEFRMLCDVSTVEDVELLRKWYWLDTNSIPDTFILMKYSTYYTNFLNQAEKKLMEEDRKLASRTMNQLVVILRKASKKLLEQRRFSHDDNHRYNFSGMIITIII